MLTPCACCSQQLGLASIFANLRNLQVLRIMVPARHTPPLIDAMGILAPLKMTTPCDSQPRRSVSSYIAASLIASPTSPTSPPLPSRSPEATQQAALDIVAGTGTVSSADARSLARARHASADAQSVTYGHVSIVNLPKDVAPHTREIKRLVKPCANLVRIEWVGRGAAGVWDVTRSAAGKEPKVTFTPIDELYRERLRAGNGIPAGNVQHASDLDAQAAFEAQQRDDHGVGGPVVNPPIRRRIRGRTTTSLASTSTFASLTSFSSGRASSSDGSPIDPLTPPRHGREVGLGFEGMSFGGVMRTSPTLSRRELPAVGGGSAAGVGRQGRSRSGDATLSKAIQEHGRSSPEIVRKSGKSASVSAGSGISGADPKMVRIIHGGG